MKHRPPHILLINPWITDFAAYNFWIRPHGLLSIASLLRRYGLRVTLVDCLESVVRKKRYGDGKFHRIEIEKPQALSGIPRKYCKYGIPEEWFRVKLSEMERPDLIGITSGMTYWYPGLFKAIKITKEFFKGVPVLLGGIYATLCYENATRDSGADYVVQGRGEMELFKIIAELFDIKLSSPSYEFREVSYPAFDLYSKPAYVTIMTSRGCPFRCPYCASHVLSGEFERRDPFEVVEEIEHWTHRYRVKNIAFYDDALLVNPSEHATVLLRELRRRNIACTFHVPNGLHIKGIDEELAGLLYQCQFKTIRLGLETSNEATQMETGGKVDNRSFREAVRNLKRAGYSGNEIGVYIMVGLPGQRVDEVEETIAYVREVGAKPKLVEYSPIPHTPLFEKAKRMSRFDLENEPLFHNNSILPCEWGGLTMADFQRLKKEARE